MKVPAKWLLLSFVSIFLSASALQAQQGQIVPMKTVQARRLIQVPVKIKDVKLITRIPLQTTEKSQINKATRQLINQNFSSKVTQSSKVRTNVEVLQKVGNRVLADAVVVFLDKNTYTATASKMQYEVVGKQVTLKRKIERYAPPMTTMKRVSKIDPATLQIKASLLKNLRIALPQGVGPKALANTPCDDISTAVTGTNDVYNIFRSAFGSASKKIGAASTKSALLDVLKTSTRLVAWNNIGHGNTNLLVQWDATIWNTDFNSAIPFKGIYNSVILLNSCLVCASPYQLKNAIEAHNPRTYIGGAVSLPIGPSERVDVGFWDRTLLKNKTMGQSLAEAASSQGLSGQFCLSGYNGKFATVEAGKFTEDCISFNPASVQAKQVGGRWKVVHGSMLMLDFGSNRSHAQRAVQIIKHYKMDRQCFVGRPNAPMKYFTVKGSAPRGAISGEDCIGFNPAKIQAKLINGRWKVVEGSHWIMDFASKEAQARSAVKVIRHYGFTRVCFVGRPNPGMMYFRK